MKLVKKYFNELTTRELYEILKARSEVFVVEHHCTYQDMDDVDFQSLHIFYQDQDGHVQAYLRAFPDQSDPKILHLGRVLTVQRGTGLGKCLLQETIQSIRQMPDICAIHLEARKHVIGFYEREGFTVCSEEFLEVGIPHVKMKLEW